VEIYSGTKRVEKKIISPEEEFGTNTGLNNLIS
jgi:hypothetical protein